MAQSKVLKGKVTLGGCSEPSDPFENRTERGLIRTDLLLEWDE